MGENIIIRRDFSKITGIISALVIASCLIGLLTGCATLKPVNKKTDDTVQPKGFYDYSKNEIQDMSWEEVKPLLDTPDKVEDYLLKYTKIRFKEDRGQHLQTPQETLDKETGDCEDFANIIRDALQFHGYEAGFLSLEFEYKGKIYSHSVGAFRGKNNGKWCFIEGFSVKNSNLNKGTYGPFDNFDDMAKKIARKLGNSKLLDYRIDYTEASFKSFFTEK
ncbi:MAG: hypothetical protein JW984_03550 [Deltaproteobacteria bacterium]|uniref:Transglutaminase-like domain-containing protein n=1 Tax=Candidatus Zymogenus saltonus TaxID=2844893 RepID=A0A9D8KB08_9DELT|nr:hypothetical protein [Candidatus Zymogenus saltonus]